MTARLRYLLLLILFAAQAATVFAVLAAESSREARSLSRFVQDEMQEFAGVAETRVRAAIAPTERLAQVTAELLAADTLDATDDELLGRYFRAQLRRAPELAGMFAGRSDGTFLFVRRDGEQMQTKQVSRVGGARRVRLTWHTAGGAVARRATDPGDDYDPRTRPWYRTATRTRRPGLTDPYVFFTSRRPGITAFAPVVRRGTVSTVVGIDLDIADLSALMSRVPLTPNGTAFVFEPDGTAVALGAGALPISATGDAMLPNLSRDSDPVTRSAYAALGPVDAKSLRASSLRRFTVGAATHIAVFHPFAAEAPGWLVAVQAPTADFAQAAGSDASISLPIVAGVALLASLLAIPLIFGVTRPIRQVHRQATVDALTGIASRGEFMRRGEAAVRGAARSQSPISLVVFDLDGFKEINDTLGHGTGDELLKAFATRLATSLRTDELAGRLGGDEFAAVLPGVDEDEAVTFVERVRMRLAASPIKTARGECSVLASAGVASSSGGERSLTELLAAADDALIAAKAAGRARSRPNSAAPLF